jgi:hypothetical protein
MWVYSFFSAPKLRIAHPVGNGNRARCEAGGAI